MSSPLITTPARLTPAAAVILFELMITDAEGSALEFTRAALAQRCQISKSTVGKQLAALERARLIEVAPVPVGLKDGAPVYAFTVRHEAVNAAVADDAARGSYRAIVALPGERPAPAAGGLSLVPSPAASLVSQLFFTPVGELSPFTPVQLRLMRLLLALQRSQGGAVSANARLLAAKVGLPAAAVATALRGLEAGGYLRRDRSEQTAPTVHEVKVYAVNEARAFETLERFHRRPVAACQQRKGAMNGDVRREYASAA